MRETVSSSAHCQLSRALPFSTAATLLAPPSPHIIIVALFSLVACCKFLTFLQLFKLTFCPFVPLALMPAHCLSFGPLAIYRVCFPTVAIHSWPVCLFICLSFDCILMECKYFFAYVLAFLSPLFYVKHIIVTGLLVWIEECFGCVPRNMQCCEEIFLFFFI